MPIYHPEEPAGGEAALRDGVTQFLTRPDVGDTHYGFLLRGPVHIEHGPPHKVYTVSLRDLAERRLLDAATEVSWSYPLFANSEPIGELEIGALPPDEGELAARAFHKTPFTQATVAALREAEKSSSTTDEDYEVRFLKIPSVYFAALWLHAAKDDILLPLREPPGRLKSNQEYKEPDVISALRPDVEEALQFEKEVGGAEEASAST